MRKPAIGFIRTLALLLCTARGDGAFADGAAPSDAAASAPEFKVSAEEISKRINPYRDAVGPVLETTTTPLGELAWIDSDSDSDPDTLSLGGEVIVSPRKSESGALYRLHEVSWDGFKDQKTGKYVERRILISQSTLNCQYILLDFTGPEAWVSPRFPDEKKYPGWVTGCINATWVEWNVKGLYDVFYFEGPSTPILFGYNSKLKAVLGDIDPDDVPPHPECKSLVPQPFGAIAECEASVKEREKKKAKPQTRSKAPG